MTTSTFNPNAAHTPIAERLKRIDGIRAVKGANDLAQILNGKTTGTDGYIYLIFDGITPKDNAVTGKNQLITVSYNIILASQTYNRDGMPEGVGERIGAVMQALAGFSPLDDDPRSRQVLQFIGTERPAYAYGYSLYPLKYQLDLVFTYKNP